MEHISLEWQFHPIGEVTLQDGKLRFPAATNRPGIYRLTVVDANGSYVYVGEADILARRFQHYRTPGPTQMTNTRLNDELRRVLSMSGRVTVDVITEARVETQSGSATPIDLYWKSARVMIEAAVLFAARQAGQNLLNR